MGDTPLKIRLEVDGQGKVVAAIESVEGKLKKAATEAKGVGDTLTKYVTAPLAAVGGAALAAAVDIDSAMDTIRARTGAVGDELDGLGEVFRNVFATVPESAGEVADAVALLAARTGETGPRLEELSRTMLALSRVTGAQLEPSIESATEIFRNFGVEAKDQVPALDFLLKASQATGVEMGSLLSTLSGSSTVLRQFGLSFEESAALVAKLGQEGIDAGSVISGLSSAMRKLADEGIAPREGLEGIFSAIRNAESAAKAADISFKVFGKSGLAMADAIRQGKLEIGDLIAKIGGSTETVAGADKDTRGFSDAMRQLKNQVELAIEPIGVRLADAVTNLTPSIARLTEKLGAAVEGFADLGPAAETALGVTILGAAGLGPAISTTANLTTTILGLAAAYGKLSKALSAPALAGIAAAGLGASAAAGGGLAIFVTELERAKAAMKGLETAAKNAHAGDLIKEILATGFEGDLPQGVEQLQQLLTRLRGSGSEAASALSIVTDATTGLRVDADLLGGSLENVAGGLGRTRDGAADVTAVLEEGANRRKQILEQIAEAERDAATAALDGVALVERERDEAVKKFAEQVKAEKDAAELVARFRVAKEAEAAGEIEQIREETFQDLQDELDAELEAQEAAADTAADMVEAAEREATLATATESEKRRLIFEFETADRLRELDELRAAGELTEEDYTRAVERLSRARRATYKAELEEVSRVGEMVGAKLEDALAGLASGRIRFDDIGELFEETMRSAFEESIKEKLKFDKLFHGNIFDLMGQIGDLVLGSGGFVDVFKTAFNTVIGDKSRVDEALGGTGAGQGFDVTNLVGGAAGVGGAVAGGYAGNKLGGQIGGVVGAVIGKVLASQAFSIAMTGALTPAAQALIARFAPAALNAALANAGLIAAELATTQAPGGIEAAIAAAQAANNAGTAGANAATAGAQTAQAANALTPALQKLTSKLWIVGAVLKGIEINKLITGNRSTSEKVAGGLTGSMDVADLVGGRNTMQAALNLAFGPGIGNFYSFLQGTFGTPSAGQMSRRGIGTILDGIPNLGAVGAGTGGRGLFSPEDAIAELGPAGDAVRVFGDIVSKTIDSGVSDVKEMQFVVSRLTGTFLDAGLSTEQVLNQIATALAQLFGDKVPEVIASAREELLRLYQEGKITLAEFTREMNALDQVELGKAADVSGIVNAFLGQGDLAAALEQLKSLGVDQFEELRKYLEEQFGPAAAGSIELLKELGIEDVTALSELSQEQLAAIVTAIQTGLGPEMLARFNELKNAGLDAFTALRLAGSDAFNGLQKVVGGDFVSTVQKIFDVLREEGITDMSQLATKSAAELQRIGQRIAGINDESGHIFELLADSGIDSFEELAALGEDAIQRLLDALLELPEEIRLRFSTTNEDEDDEEGPDGADENGPNGTGPQDPLPLQGSNHQGGWIPRTGSYLLEEGELIIPKRRVEYATAPHSLEPQGAAADGGGRGRDEVLREVRELLRGILREVGSPKFFPTLDAHTAARVAAEGRRRGIDRGGDPMIGIGR